MERGITKGSFSTLILVDERKGDRLEMYPDTRWEAANTK
jgi:hypothetical protein